jgi:hypothetical protein
LIGSTARSRLPQSGQALHQRCLAFALEGVALAVRVQFAQQFTEDIAHRQESPRQRQHVVSDSCHQEVMSFA